MGTSNVSIEVIVVPVTDVDRALRFYILISSASCSMWTTLLFRCISRRSAHLPPGSHCSIQIGKGLTDAPAGSLRNVHLVVTDLEATRASLLEREVKVSAIRHKTPIGAWDGTFASGLDPARGDYASFANFSDPDGNSWVLQERGYRNV